MSKSKRREQQNRRRQFATFCISCGHRASDHADGYMGAKIGDDWYCHQDDHTYYVPASDMTHREASALADFVLLDMALRGVE